MGQNNKLKRRPQPSEIVNNLSAVQMSCYLATEERKSMEGALAFTYSSVSAATTIALLVAIAAAAGRSLIGGR